MLALTTFCIYFTIIQCCLLLLLKRAYVTCPLFCVAPVGVPQHIRTSTTSRTITVNWDEITCRERNGAITNYLVELKKDGVGEPIPGMLMINEKRFFANGSQVIPFINYTFRVAGRNMQGQGPYSEIMTIQTMEDSTYVLDVY